MVILILLSINFIYPLTYSSGIYLTSYYDFLHNISIRGFKPKIIIDNEIIDIDLLNNYIELVPLNLLQIDSVEIIRDIGILNYNTLYGGAINIKLNKDVNLFHCFAGSETGDPLIFEWTRPLDSLPNKERIGPSLFFITNKRSKNKIITFSGGSERYCTLSHENRLFRENISQSYYEWTYPTSFNFGITSHNFNLFSGIKHFSGWQFIPLLGIDFLIRECNSLFFLKFKDFTFLLTNSFFNIRNTFITKNEKLNCLNIKAKYRQIEFFAKFFQNYFSYSLTLFSSKYVKIIYNSIEFIPSFALIYHNKYGFIFEHKQKIKYKKLSINYSFNYSFPTVYELFSDIKVYKYYGIKGNKNLLPERKKWLELNFSDLISIFYGKIMNAIQTKVEKNDYFPEFNSNLLLISFINENIELIYGCEISVPFKLSYLSGNINYSFINNKYLPKNQINLKLNINRELLFSLLFHYQSCLFDKIHNELPSYNRIDLIVSKELFNKFRISVYVFNLLNKKYKMHPKGLNIGMRVFVSGSYIF